MVNVNPTYQKIPTVYGCLLWWVLPNIEENSYREWLSFMVNVNPAYKKIQGTVLRFFYGGCYPTEENTGKGLLWWVSPNIQENSYRGTNTEDIIITVVERGADTHGIILISLRENYRAKCKSMNTKLRMTNHYIEL